MTKRTEIAWPRGLSKLRHIAEGQQKRTLTSDSLHLPQSGISEQTRLFLEWGPRQTPFLAPPYSSTNIYLQPGDSRHQARHSEYKGESVTHSQNTGARLLTRGRGQPLPSHLPRNRHSSERRGGNLRQASLAAGLGTQWRLQTCLLIQPGRPERAGGPAPS